MIDADRAVPVFATADIDVDASPEAVWDTLTDLRSWPQWHAGVKSVLFDGPFAVGSTFKWSAGTGFIRSEIVTADRPSRVAWKGYHGRIEAVHVWTMEPVGRATTHVHTAESWSGALPRLLPGTMRKTLNRLIRKGLPGLKAEAERRYRQ